MTTHSIPVVVIASIECYVGAYHLFIYFRRRGSRQDLTFALSCFGVALYSAVCIGLYNVDSPEQGLAWQRWQFVTLGLLAFTFLLFVRDYAGRRPTKFGYVLAVYFVLSMVFEAVDRSEWTWLNIPATKHIPLPFIGYEVVYYEMTPGPFTILVTLVGLGLFAYVFVIGVQTYRSGQRKKAIPLLVAMLLFFAGLANDAAVNAGVYSFLYTVEYSYVGMVVVMAYALSNELVEAAEVRHALEESEERFRMLAENVPGAIYLCKNDARWTMLYLNDAVESLTGYPKEDFLEDRISFVNLYHPEDSAGIFAAVEKALAARTPFHVVYRIKHRSGGWRWVEEAGAGIYREGELQLLEGFLSDITEKKRAEEERRGLEAQVQQAQKLESLGVLAGGIAHDFNNLLMGILGNADLALDEISPASPARQSIKNIETAGKRAAELCRQMLAYSGKGRFVIEALNLNEVVEEMAHLLRAAISKNAILRYQFAEHLPAVEADATQMRQVIMNLITNASDAIEEKSAVAGAQGVISIMTGVLDCDAAYLRNAPLDEALPEGRYVYIEVSDTGCGMDAATREKIFDPFFTTKFTGRGLGLSAALGIVRGHRGVLKIYSEPGQGSSFKLLFPALTQAAETSQEEARPPEDWAPSGTVLLVDDEEAVRGVGKRMLEKIGFEVLTAEDGRQALALFEQHRNTISCVLLDLTMPHMDGEQTFRELRRIREDVPVILSSGYNQQEITNRFVGRGLAGFVQKPYQMATLAQALREVFRT